MKYTIVKNPIWNKEKTKIDCVVDFVNLGEIPFTADPTDPNIHCQEIYARCVAGEFGPIADYVLQIDEGENPQSTAPIPQIPVTNTGEIL